MISYKCPKFRDCTSARVKRHFEMIIDKVYLSITFNQSLIASMPEQVCWSHRSLRRLIGALNVLYHFQTMFLVIYLKWNFCSELTVHVLSTIPKKWNSHATVFSVIFLYCILLFLYSLIYAIAYILRNDFFTFLLSLLIFWTVLLYNYIFLGIFHTQEKYKFQQWLFVKKTWIHLK